MQLEFTPQELERLLNYLAGQKWGEVNPILAHILPQVEQQAQEAKPALRAVDSATG